MPASCRCCRSDNARKLGLKNAAPSISSQQSGHHIINQPVWQYKCIGNLEKTVFKIPDYCYCSPLLLGLTHFLNLARLLNKQGILDTMEGLQFMILSTPCLKETKEKTI